MAIENGPDGALYVVDMYRAVIEHPQFMPSELQHRPDLRWGEDRGRIWRIVPADQHRKTWQCPTRLGLDRRAGQAAGAARGLVARNGRPPALRAAGPRGGRAAGGAGPLRVRSLMPAVQALWALAGLNAIDDECC